MHGGARRSSAIRAPRATHPAAALRTDRTRRGRDLSIFRRDKMDDAEYDALKAKLWKFMVSNIVVVVAGGGGEIIRHKPR